MALPEPAVVPAATGVEGLAPAANPFPPAPRGWIIAAARRTSSTPSSNPSGSPSIQYCDPRTGGSHAEGITP